MKIWKEPLVLFGGFATAIGLAWYAYYTARFLEEGGPSFAAAWLDIFRQAAWVLVGLVMCVLLARLDCRMVSGMAFPLLVFSGCLMLAALLCRLGSHTYHAGQCLPFGIRSFYPARWAILVTVVYLAARTAKSPSGKRTGGAEPGRPDSAKQGDGWCLACILFVALMLVTFSGGLKCFALLSVTALGCTLAAREWRAAGLFAALCAVFGLLFVGSDSSRLSLALSGGVFDSHPHRCLPLAGLMLRSGGWFGVGLGNSLYRPWLTQRETPELLLASIGEELGWLHILAALACVVFLLLAGAAIAYRAADPFGRRLAGGIVALLGVQALFHVALILGWLPVPFVCFPMPFVSELGLNACLPLACGGLLLSVARRKEEAKLEGCKEAR